ncbi:hypothetical protein [Cellulomonas sp.]|uniref:hypothetical protein n=1 Tax=Cellulomonas sp. TaxID=40001 RepID=UPI0025842D79|nr:hypothetical protein [Cellulomonas sp.]MCR6689860.1 hypothetical protein [Cellulomonas sp.]
MTTSTPDGGRGTRGSGAQLALRVTAAVLGVATLAAGAVAVFVTENGAGAAALIAAGVALAVIGGVFDRIKAFEAAGVKVELAEVREKLATAASLEEAGQPELAAELRDEAIDLLSSSSPAALRFKQVRATPPGWQRTIELERQMHDWEEEARRVAPSLATLERGFDQGDEAGRAMALAMMVGAPAAASPRVAEAAIAHPRSAFEQFHGLRVAQTIARSAPAAPTTIALGEVVRENLEQGRFGSPDSDRCTLAKRILELVAPS